MAVGEESCIKGRTPEEIAPIPGGAFVGHNTVADTVDVNRVKKRDV